MKKFIFYIFLTLGSVFLLTACGGSLMEKLTGISAGVSVDNSMTSNLSSYCNVEMPKDESTLTSSNGKKSSIASTEKFFIASEKQDLLIGYPNSALPNFATNPLKFPHMGVSISGILGNQAVACVKEINPWVNRMGDNLPIDFLSGKALTGFELSANFTTPEGKTLFGVPKTISPVGNTLSICRWEGVGKSAPWTCVKPTRVRHQIPILPVFAHPTLTKSSTYS
jgi:hypothetical protein